MKAIRKRIRQAIEALQRNEGMTLIEIMIVVTIIAILGALVVPRFMDMPQKAKVSAAKQQMKNFEMALQKYSFEKGTFPSTEEGLQELVNEKIMKKIPEDPWGNPYQYRSPGETDPDFEIWSYGADGKEGGEGFKADIKSWE